VSRLKIAVLSGKGGTGKTLVSTNLANILSKNIDVELLDCDVEEPNSSLFYNVDFEKETSVNIDLPVVDNDICTKCRKCADSCQFGAINVFSTGTMVFESLCHGCGVCSDVCPVNAITERKKEIGTIKYGKLNKINFGEGLLNIGEPSGVKVIRELKEFSNKIDVQILDSPPGASCSVVETLRDADYAILVTEPTPFGLHDLKSAQEIAENMGIKHGVVINRFEEEYDEMNEFLEAKSVDTLQKIPFSREIAEIYSKGDLISDKEEYAHLFEKIAEKVGVFNV